MDSGTGARAEVLLRAIASELGRCWSACLQLVHRDANPPAHCRDTRVAATWNRAPPCASAHGRGPLTAREPRGVECARGRTRARARFGPRAGDQSRPGLARPRRCNILCDRHAVDAAAARGRRDVAVVLPSNGDVAASRELADSRSALACLNGTCDVHGHGHRTHPSRSRSAMASP